MIKENKCKNSVMYYLIPNYQTKIRLIYSISKYLDVNWANNLVNSKKISIYIGFITLIY